MCVASCGEGDLEIGIPPAALACLCVMTPGFSRARYPACTALLFQSPEAEEIDTIGMNRQSSFHMQAQFIMHFRIASVVFCQWLLSLLILWLEDYCEQEILVLYLG
ncbi:hypothetical protein EDD15DRAFT_2195857 [Pisolithus albus]|nr:hypothetical protein EDD15DRAFT_2195857 [Pisolithus albus]